MPLIPSLPNIHFPRKFIGVAAVIGLSVLMEYLAFRASPVISNVECANPQRPGPGAGLVIPAVVQSTKHGIIGTYSWTADFVVGPGQNPVSWYNGVTNLYKVSKPGDSPVVLQGADGHRVAVDLSNGKCTDNTSVQPTAGSGSN